MSFHPATQRALEGCQPQRRPSENARDWVRMRLERQVHSDRSKTETLFERLIFYRIHARR